MLRTVVSIPSRRACAVARLFGELPESSDLSPEFLEVLVLIDASCSSSIEILFCCSSSQRDKAGWTRRSFLGELWECPCLNLDVGIDIPACFCRRGICHATDVFDVLDVCPVSEEAGERMDSEKGGDGFWVLIFLARILSMFFVKTVRGISGSARTLAE